MFFCFDVMEGQSESVVLTCPKVDLAEKVSIAKCCPEGICASNGRPWQIPINGHLFNSTELWNKKKLVYDNRSLVSFMIASLIIHYNFHLQTSNQYIGVFHFSCSNHLPPTPNLLCSYVGVG